MCLCLFSFVCLSCVGAWLCMYLCMYVYMYEWIVLDMIGMIGDVLMDSKENIIAIIMTSTTLHDYTTGSPDAKVIASVRPTSKP